ncbi:[NiFe]-hydrogenase assembly chaperone HybE [Paraburkholderia dinghuensis]|uniref:[NiFe]-hydrogenase assembly chaperone HybE n=1 Tax=Paraburkholderia dinghuensis TaxID=2305225 RepID=UPI001FE5C65B|nr:[NiFe]-hydrogenase assembly chaperone HybE [Paraburkholderia dinghuensis]
MTPVASSFGAELTHRIESAFGHIAQTRMRDLPLLNPRLSVAAVGFRPWQSGWIGVLVTPWSINLLQFPTPDAPFAPARADAVFEIALPGATMPFMPARLDTLGEFRMCSLFSPAQQFADQETALATAHETLRLLFEPDDSAPANLRSASPTTRSQQDRPTASRRRLFGLRP